jgi:uncharacterized protein
MKNFPAHFITRLSLGLALLGVCASTVVVDGLGIRSAQAQVGGNLPGKIPDEQLFGFIGKDPLPPGTLAWQMLRQVKLVESKPGDRKDAKGAASKAPTMRPEYSPRLIELDKQEVKLYGFVMPLSTSSRQKHFLLSPLPSHCPFCVYQGPDSLVEVIAKTPVEFNQWEPILVTGRFELVNDAQLFYRLTNAEAVKL